MSRDAFALDIALELYPETDPRAPGGAVTVALCGHWEHEGSCRWPHNSRIETQSIPTRLRTVVVTPHEDRVEVIRRIEVALGSDDRWRLLQIEERALVNDELALAERLTGV